MLNWYKAVDGRIQLKWSKPSERELLELEDLNDNTIKLLAVKGVNKQEWINLISIFAKWGYKVDNMYVSESWDTVEFSTAFIDIEKLIIERYLFYKDIITFKQGNNELNEDDTLYSIEPSLLWKYLEDK